MTTITEEARREMIQRALEAHDTGDAVHDVYWRGEMVTRPVVQLPIDALLLNPNSHRIRSQLESHEQRLVVARDPYSAEAQNIIADILRGSEFYDELVQSLAQEGQRDYGVVTGDGVLVNANTRAVALRQLHKTHIKVIVLPGGEDDLDIERLEARLQLQNELKSDYTFPNELVFVEDMRTKLGYTTHEIATQLDWTERDVEQYQRMLARVEAIRTGGAAAGTRIPLTEFDDKEQSLKDLDQWYEGLSEDERVAAQPVLEARSLALIVSGGTFGYKKMREIRDADFVSDYLEPELVDNAMLAPALPALRSATTNGSAAPPGLDLLDDDEAHAAARLDVSPLLHALVTSHGKPEAKIPTKDGDVTVDREELRRAVRDVCERAATSAGEDRRHGTALERPAALAAEAARKLNVAPRAYLRVHDRTDFAPGGLRNALSDVDAELAALRSALGD
jgi:hypothetical protein